MNRKSPCELNIFCVLTTTESRVKIWYQLNAFKPPPVAKTAVRSKTVVLLLLIYCFFMLLPLFVGVLCMVLALYFQYFVSF